VTKTSFGGRERCDVGHSVFMYLRALARFTAMGPSRNRSVHIRPAVPRFDEAQRGAAAAVSLSVKRVENASSMYCRDEHARVASGIVGIQHAVWRVTRL